MSGNVVINAFHSRISAISMAMAMEIATQILRSVVTPDIVFQKFRLKSHTHIGVVRVNVYHRNRNVSANVRMDLMNVETRVYIPEN